MPKTTKTIFNLFALFSIFLIVAQSLQAQNVVYNLSNFAREVFIKNPQIKVDEVDPKLQEAIFLENYKIKFNSSLSAGYNQKTNTGTNPTNTLSLGTEFQYTFAPVSTKVTVGLNVTSLDITTEGANAADPIQTSLATSVTSLSITQPLLFGGLAYISPQRQLDIDRYLTRIQRAAFNSKLNGNILKSLIDYHRYLVNKDLIFSSKRSLANSREILAFNRKKVRNSTLNRKDLLANQSQVLQNQISLEETELNQKILFETLLGYINIKPNSEQAKRISFEDELVLPDSLELDPDQAYENALSQRSDLLAIKLEIEAAKNAIRLGKAYLFPTLNASIGVDFLGQGEDIAGTFNYDISDSNGIDIKWGLNFLMYLDALSYRITTTRPQLQLIQAMQKLSLQESSIKNSINSSVLLVNQAFKVLKQREIIRRYMSDRYAISRKDYVNGKIDFSQHLQNSIDIQTARINFQVSKIDFYSKLLNHYFLEGTLLERYNLTGMPVDGKLKLRNLTDFINSALK